MEVIMKPTIKEDKKDRLKHYVTVAHDSLDELYITIERLDLNDEQYQTLQDAAQKVADATNEIDLEITYS